MSQSIFQLSSLVTVSALQKLLKQQPQENAVIALNNLLATKEIRQISVSDVDRIETDYKISLKKEFSLNLEEFYATYTRREVSCE